MKYASKKISEIPIYKMDEIAAIKDKLVEEGVDVIDLSIGDPDLPTPEPIINKLIEELDDPLNHKYPNFTGCIEFREAVAKFYKDNYNVYLNSETEILILVGSKEGISRLIPSIIDPGDYVLTPDPAYPVYDIATNLAFGQAYKMPLTEENDLKPDLTTISKDILEKAKLMFLNYPNNPTSATVDISFFEDVVSFARENNIMVANDSAYNQVTFHDYKSPSILEVEHSQEVAVEIGSLSKTYSMTGWRIGYIAGNEEVISSLATYKSNMGNSVFTPIQKAAAYALNSDQSYVKKYNQIYQDRMETMIEALRSINIDVKPIRAGIFIWAPVPEGYTSNQFVSKVMEEKGVILTPGDTFGPSGEGYFRISLSVPNERLNEAVKRLKAIKY